MRHILPPDPTIGDIRTVTGFVIRRRIGNEIRWFERSSWVEEYKFVYHNSIYPCPNPLWPEWVPIKWVEGL